jgi:hypothetical protein
MQRAVFRDSERFHEDLGMELVSLFGSGLGHDVVIVSKDGEWIDSTLLAHSEILRARSMFFEKLFASIQTSDFDGLLACESSRVSILTGFDEKQSCQEVVLKMDWNAEAVAFVIKTMYKGVCNFQSFQEAHDDEIGLQVREMAQVFEINELLDHFSGLKRRKVGTCLFYQDHLKKPNALKAGGEMIPVSFPLLAARSSFFNSMLQGKWIESQQEIIEVQGVPEDILVDIVRFLHLDLSVEITSLEQLQHLLQWSLYFGIPSLTAWCEHVLKTDYLDAESVCLIWNVVSSHDDTKHLNQICSKFFRKNFLSCSRFPGFFRLSPELMKSALDSGNISADSLEMMKILKIWAEAQFDGVECEGSRKLFFEMMPPSTLFNVKHRQLVLGGFRGPDLFRTLMSLA